METTPMKRLALAAAGLAILSGLAYAQTTPTPAPSQPPAVQSPAERPSAEQRDNRRMERRAARMEERMNRRFERLKNDLALTPQQQPLWSPVEAQLRKMQADRRAYWQANAGRARNAELPDRIDLMSERMSANATQMRELSGVIRPLWATLSDSQKDTVRKAIRQGRGEDGRGEGGRGERRG
jgi:hypothetical protein